MRPQLPRKPASLLEDGQHRHARPEDIVSPKPQVPPVFLNQVTTGLEYQASVVGKQQQQQQQQAVNSSNDPTMSKANAMVANWVASVPTNRSNTPYTGPLQHVQQGMQQHPHMPASSRQGGPPIQGHNGPLSHKSNTRGTPPSNRPPPAAGFAGGPPPPHLQVNQAYDTQQRYPPSPSHTSMHPPRASSMVVSSSASPMPNGGGNYPSYDPHFDRHHSVSDLNLDSSANKYLSASSRNDYGEPPSNANLGASTSRLNPVDTRYRTTSMVSGTPPQSRNPNASTSRPSSTSGHSRPQSDPDVSLAHSMSMTSISTTNSALCIALPSQAELAHQREAAHFTPNPAAARVSWAKSVLKFVERHQAASAGGEFSKITDPTLVKWTDESIRLILSYADNVTNPVPEALYLRGELSSSGKFPSYRSKDLSSAFRDFETAANLGYYAAWAKIALAYETYGEQNKSQADFDRAKRAYDEGVQKNEVTCTYVSYLQLPSRVDSPYSDKFIT